MPSLEGKPLGTEYKRLVTIDQSSNTGIDGTLRKLQTGDGVDTPLSLSSDSVFIQGGSNSTSAIRVLDETGTRILVVDTTDKIVKGGANRVNFHTHYKNMSMTNTTMQAQLAGNHYPISLDGNYPSLTPITFGAGTDPATAFTTADSTAFRASDLAPFLWYIHDDITLDEIIHIEGADNATGDTTRMHLFRYDLTSGATNSLTNGTLLAHSADTTNAGSEQIYKQSWTIDSGNVTSGKVIIAFFEPVSINSDYSINLSIKYHIQ